MNLYSRFVSNTLLRTTILLSCFVIIILLSWYMSSNFEDNFTAAERKDLKNAKLYGDEEHWHLLLAVAAVLAFLILLLQCLSCLSTLARAKGRLDTPKKVKIMRFGENLLNMFGALFSFICLLTAVIRLASIYRYDAECGMYECDFRHRLIVVAVLYFLNTILFGALVLIQMQQQDYFQSDIVEGGERLIGSSRVTTTYAQHTH